MGGRGSKDRERIRILEDKLYAAEASLHALSAVNSSGNGPMANPPVVEPPDSRSKDGASRSDADTVPPCSGFPWTDVNSNHSSHQSEPPTISYGHSDSEGDNLTGGYIEDIPPFQSIDHALIRERLEHTKRLIEKDLRVIPLPRGGDYVKTKIGPIQFGMPPETIKDSMALGLPLPTYYVVPKRRFDQSMRINVAECEFPAYYNFFVYRKKIRLITDPYEELSIRKVFQETLFGPVDLSSMKLDYPKDYPPEKLPTLQSEIEYFQRNPFDPAGTRIQMETLIEFIHFDEEGVARIPGTDVEIVMTDSTHVVREGGEEVAVLSHQMKISEPQLTRLSCVLDETKVFDIPDFGVTFLGSSHGFDPNGTTTGFVIWINGRGIMVDPPPYSGHLLAAQGISGRVIDAVILTHCHADHDSGTFQKILEEKRITVMTTTTIFNSFVRKYAALLSVQEKALRRLVHFNQVKIGEPVNCHGGTFYFWYTLHAIPCVGFQVRYGGKSLAYSADTCNDPPRIRKLCEEGILSEQRRNELLSFPWDSSVILHEAGVPPIHTPMSTLASLPEHVKARLYCVHTSSKDFSFSQGLKIARVGVENTIRIKVEISEEEKAVNRATKLLDLVSSIDVFQSWLPMGKARDVLQTATRRFYELGHVIESGGKDGCRRICIIEAGLVSVTSPPKEPGGQPRTRMLTVGDLFGAHVLLTGTEGPMLLRAVTPLTLVTFEEYDFVSLIKSTAAFQGMFDLNNATLERMQRALDSNSLLSTMTDSQQIELKCIMREKRFSAGDAIWEVGRPLRDEFYTWLIVFSGTLELTRDGADDPLAVSLGMSRGSVSAGDGTGSNRGSWGCPVCSSREDGRLTVATPMVSLGIFTTGAFVGEGDTFVPHANFHRTTLRVVSDALVFLIKGSEMQSFFLHNPGVQLACLGKNFIV
eukprot:jgi/Mesvir1/15042/Mv14695-RA.1